jgi:predicted PurR-regulated permease PerM
MSGKILQTYFLVALLLGAALLAFFIFRPFLIVLALAAIFAVVLQPVYQAFLRRTPSSPGFAAFMTMLISVVVILVPLTFILVQITGDAQRLYTSLADGAGRTHLATVIDYANSAVVQYAPNFSLSPADLSASIDQYMQDGLSWLIQHVGGAFGGATRFLLHLFVFLIALYYLLRDGAKLRRLLISVSPLPDIEDRTVLERLELAIHSVIRGSLMIAFLQGILTGIGFALFGIGNSFLWGVVAAFSALIPGIGTSLVLVPAVAYLFIVGSTTPAIGLLLWSVVAVGLIDNFLGPRLVGKGMQLHPLVVLLSVFGGLALFGAVGVFLGPLCISLLLALLSIHQRISREPV